MFDIGDWHSSFSILGLELPGKLLYGALLDVPRLS
jgi:hypothetical protein